MANPGSGNSSSLPRRSQDDRLTHPKYRPDIDGLRAIAILAVLGFHAFPDWVKGGFIGVDIFFVISGFLISTIIFENLERGSFTFAGFYFRRVRRIFPALLLMLIAISIFGWFSLLPDEYKQLGKHVSGASGFIANLLLWKESGYFDAAAEAKPLLHLWSLGIEEQFYIVWPLVLWLGWKRRVNLLKVIAAIAVASFVLNVWVSQSDPVAAFYSPLTRFWEILAGAGLAYLALRSGKEHAGLPVKNANVKSLLGAASIVAGILLITQKVVFPGWWALLPTFGAVAIISGGAHAWVNRTILANRVLVWIGLISYPLYLWHWPIFALARIVEGEALSRSTRIAAVIASILLAWLTYAIIEKRIQKIQNGKLALVLAGMMLCLGLTGYVCFRTGGFESRFGKDIAILSGDKYFNGKTAEEYLGGETCFLVTSTYSSFEKNGCEERLFPDQPKVFLIGDSHMTFLSLGLREFLSTQKYNIFQYSAAHCTPLSLNDKRDRCREINRHVLEKIKMEKPSYVVIFAYYLMVQSDPDYGEGIPYDEFLHQKTIELEREGIKHVLLIGHMPVWAGTLPEVLGRKFIMRGKPIPERTYDGVVQESLEWDRKLREKDYPANVTYVSLKDFLCNESGCVTVVGRGADQNLLVFDYGHLTIPGARFIVQNLLTRFFDTPRNSPAENETRP